MSWKKVLLAVFIFLFSFLVVSKAELSGWQYRIPITIQENSGNDLTDYQIAINLTYNKKMQPDFSDIRFTWYNSSSKKEVEIPYWIESKVDSSWAYVWVKVPYIPASSTTTIYVYYGNVTPVSSASNGEATFDFFDDFNVDLSKWYVRSGTWIIDTSVSNGVLQSPTGDDYQIATSSFTCGNCRLVMRVRALSTSIGADIFGRSSDANNLYKTDIEDAGSTMWKRVAGTWINLGSVSYIPNFFDWRRIEFDMFGPNLKSITENGTHTFIYSATDTTFTSGYVGIRKGGSEYSFFQVDWFFASKITDPEPTIVFGNEQYLGEIPSSELPIGYVILVKMVSPLVIGSASLITILSLIFNLEFDLKRIIYVMISIIVLVLSVLVLVSLI